MLGTLGSGSPIILHGPVALGMTWVLLASDIVNPALWAQGEGLHMHPGFVVNEVNSVTQCRNHFI